MISDQGALIQMVKSQSIKYNIFLMERFRITQGLSQSPMWIRFGANNIRQPISQVLFSQHKGKEIKISLQIIKLNNQKQQLYLVNKLKIRHKYRYYYYIDIQFINNANIVLLPLDIFKYIKQNINTFNFNQQNHLVSFNEFHNFCFKLKFYQRFNPIDLLTQAMVASKIIRQIKLQSSQLVWKNVISVIQRLSTEDLFGKYSIQQIPLIDMPLLDKSLQKTKQMFIGLFKFSYTDSNYRYNKKIYLQSRFQEAAYWENRFIYHPTDTTKEIFQLAELKGENLIYIHGQGGTGKSISLSLLAILHNSIENLNINMEKEMYEFIVKSQIDFNQQFPKYFYFSLVQDLENEKKFYQTIYQQLPYDLKAKYSQDISLVSTIKTYYQKKNIKVIYICDQINLYYSFIRKLDQKGKDEQKIWSEIQRISAILKRISSQKVVFGSSQNIQTSLVQKKNKMWFSFDKPKVTPYKIHYEQRLAQPRGLLQMLETIQFQIRNTIWKQFKDAKQGQLREHYDSKRKQFYLLEQCIKSNPQEVQFLSELTHQRVKSYLNKNKTIVGPIAFEKNANPEDKLKMVLTQLKLIYADAIQSQSKKYQRFLDQDDAQLKYKRYKQITRIRSLAITLDEKDIKSPSFQYQFKVGEQITNPYIQLFREHAQIKGDKLSIYYSPQTYIKITQFLNNKLDFAEAYLHQIVQANADTMSWVGTTFDTCHVYIFTRHDIYLQLEQAFSVCCITKPYASFQAFLNIFTKEQRQLIGKKKTQKTQQKQIKEQIQLEKMLEQIPIKIAMQNSVFIRFQNLFNILFQNYNSIQRSYICAAPNTKQPDFLKYDIFHSGNSQAIDFLLIQNVDRGQESPMEIEVIDFNREDWNSLPIRSYNLYTYDFCVSFDQCYINNKIKKAKLFFQKFKRIVKQQNSYQGYEVVKALIEKRNKQVQNFNKINNKTEMKYKTHMTYRYQFQKIEHTILVPKLMAKKNKNNNHQQSEIKLKSLEEISFQLKKSENNKYKSQQIKIPELHQKLSQALKEHLNALTIKCKDK